MTTTSFPVGQILKAATDAGRIDAHTKRLISCHQVDVNQSIRLPNQRLLSLVVSSHAEDGDS